MAIHSDEFKGFSTALYSTWLWHRATRSMFDAGEGIGINMKNYVFAIENVFLTHGHHDHVGGVSGLVRSRASARGDKEKPLSIYHPKGWDTIEALKVYIRDSSYGMKYDLNWNAIDPGQDIQVDNLGKVFVRPFEVVHSKRMICLGFSIVEKRFRLKAELVGKSNKEIAALALQNGQDAINEPYEKILAAYSGDCASFNYKHVLGADVLFHEATFLVKDDMDVGGGHSTVAQAIAKAVEADVGELVLYHISPRYNMNIIKSSIQRIAAAIKFKGAIKMLDGFSMVEIQQ